VASYLIGIDEAGRGPLAGPVSVGAAMVRSGFDWSHVGGIRDSKKMTPFARERFYARMLEMRRAGTLAFSVAFASAAMIDEQGMTRAIRFAMARALRNIEADPDECNIFLDGALQAPEMFLHQQTIIGGDDVLPVISLAAVAAKVSRDRYMSRIAEEYPGYGFDIHKGYGTKAHRDAIAKRGLCPLHRATFCSNIV
jgi:ribonuclease HII